MEDAPHRPPSGPSSRRRSSGHTRSVSFSDTPPPPPQRYTPADVQEVLGDRGALTEALPVGIRHADPTIALASALHLTDP